jgi:putative oxidoreductase
MYENWAPVVARVVFGLVFLMSAFYKIPGTETFTMQVGMSADAGIPFATLAVGLAFVLEVVGGIALIAGWHTRMAAAALAAFVVLIALFFFRDWSDQTIMGNFISCMTQAAGLLYVSVYGARHFAYAPDGGVTPSMTTTPSQSPLYGTM